MLGIVESHERKMLPKRSGKGLPEEAKSIRFAEAEYTFFYISIFQIRQNRISHSAGRGKKIIRYLLFFRIYTNLELIMGFLTSNRSPFQGR
jgi:hypothetical protein